MLALTAQAMVVVSRVKETTARKAATMTMMMKLDRTGPLPEGAAGAYMYTTIIVEIIVMISRETNNMLMYVY